MKSDLAIAAVLIALSVTLGLLLVAVPNVEGVSAVSFFSGAILGAGGGAFVGAVSMGLFSVLNPLGPAVFPVLLAQMAGMALMGCSGALWLKLAGSRGRAAVLAGVAGGVLTFIYDVLTNYGFAVTMGRWSDPLPFIAAGIPFSVVHIVSNALVFAGVATLVHSRKRPRRDAE
jgi:uncharacterized membrane protein